MINNGSMLNINIDDEIRKSYLDYALSVIIGRSIPDIRDGLKPVQRRIVYSMFDMGNVSKKPYRKSARVVGEVIGKYHPHGDAAVYDALVRLAQDFSMRYPLVDGQGNFGSIDGDPPAAMRYTEIRLQKIANDLMQDIEKETVKFTPNYDSSTSEPEVLPSRIPNLLMNGASGIAVGMATNTLPHNLGEIVDSLILLLENDESTVDQILGIVKGPDLPTGGIILGSEGILDAYKLGRGTVKVRSRVFVEKDKKNTKANIIVKELPYQVNKARLLQKINELTKNKVIEEIDELRDESDRDGTRIVITLKKNEIADVVLNKLYKHTQMEVSYGIIFLAIDEGMPKVFKLREILENFLKFRKEIILNRTHFDLNKAKEQCHILEGLKTALENIDEVLRIVRGSQTAIEAKNKLMKSLRLSEKQSQAILDMRLQKLTRLEINKLIEEYNEIQKRMKYLQSVLQDEEIVKGIIKDELLEVKENYADERRTDIVEDQGEINREDLILEENMVVTITHRGYVKRTPLSIYKTQRRGGKGKVGITILEEDFVEHLFISSTHSYLLVFTDIGKVYWIKVHELPEASRIAKGKPIVNLLPLQENENVTSILPIREFKEGTFVCMATKKGYVKRTDVKLFSRPRSTGILAINIDPDDRLISTVLSSGEDKIFFATHKGKSLTIEETQVRPMQRTARGVKGINLRKGDSLIAMTVLQDIGPILTITENGYGKRTLVENYRVQNRAGLGLINIKVDEKNGHAVYVFQVNDADTMVIITNMGKLIRINASDISVIGRNTMGVKLINLKESEKAVAAQKVIDIGE
jgi:DNA gyrase subunit A